MTFTSLHFNQDAPTNLSMASFLRFYHLVSTVAIGYKAVSLTFFISQVDVKDIHFH